MLYIYCSYDLNTTNIDMPRRVFKTYDIQYTSIEITTKNITQIFFPAIGALLRDSLRVLDIGFKINKIEPKAFDELSNLQTLIIRGQLDDSSILSRLVSILFH